MLALRKRENVLNKLSVAITVYYLLKLWLEIQLHPSLQVAF